MTNKTLAQQLRGAASVGNGQPLTGLSIAARASLSAHALNNEETRGNAQIARQVNVVVGDGVVQANAVSGDVLKHGFIDNLRALALATPDAALPVCEPCRKSDANRINEDPQFQQALKGIGKDDTAKVIDEVVRRCVVDDLGGLLVTQE